jgi:RHS repeat-associated protein
VRKGLLLDSGSRPRLSREYLSNNVPVLHSYTDYGYDPVRDWLSSITHYTGAGTLIDQFQYFRTDGTKTDETGRILREVNAAGATRHLDYDELGRLKLDDSPENGKREYVYDAQGNRTQKITTWTNNNNVDYYQYDDLDRLVWINRNVNGEPLEGQDKPYHKLSYDALGRMTKRERKLNGDSTVEVHTFEWDGQDKLRRAVKNGVEALTATYDGDGLRVGKTDSTGMHTYHREPGGTLMEDSVSGGTGAVYTPGFAQRSGTENRFFHEDWLGSTRATTNLQTGAVKGTHQWDAFGQRSATGSGEFQGSSFMWGGGWGYETEDAGRFDKGLGLVLMGQRYYDPEVGRFISADPIGLAGGFNQYAYCDNDPVNAVDPTGLYEEYKPGWAQGFENGFGAAGTILGGVGGFIGGGGGGAIAGGGVASLVTAPAGAYAGGAAGAGAGLVLGRGFGWGVASLIRGAGDLLSQMRREPQGGEIGPAGGGGGRGQVEPCGSYDVARNRALKWLWQRGFRAERKVLSRGLGGSRAGQEIGMSTADGRVGFRVEWDPENGAHINVFDHNAPRGQRTTWPHFTFAGGEEVVQGIVKRFGRR